MIFAAGPLIAAPPTIGETAITGAPVPSIQSRKPGSARMGSMLRYGLEGQMR